MTPGDAHRHHPLPASREHVGEQILELSNLVAAVNLVRSVVALDPKVCLRRAKAVRSLHGRRKFADEERRGARALGQARVGHRVEVSPSFHGRNSCETWEWYAPIETLRHE